MRFAHISDLHLCMDPKSNPDVNDNSLEIAAALVEDLKRISKILDFVIISGDLSDDADPKSFRHFEELFADLSLPFFIVPGNHDGPAAYLKHKKASKNFAEADISGRLVNIGNLRILGINTCIEAMTTGALSPEIFELLEQELSGSHASKLLIVMHHPPFAPGLSEFNDISVLERKDRFAQILQKAEMPPIILCGHVHRPYFATWNGANCFIAGSPARLFEATPPFGNAPIQPSNEPFSYFIHEIGTINDHVMTSRWLRV